MKRSAIIAAAVIALPSIASADSLEQRIKQQELNTYCQIYAAALPTIADLENIYKTDDPDFLLNQALQSEVDHNYNFYSQLTVDEQKKVNMGIIQRAKGYDYRAPLLNGNDIYTKCMSGTRELLDE